MKTQKTIIAMFGLNRDIEVGDRMYLDVSLVSWKCWLKFFSWAFREGLGTPSLFQGGWAVSLNNSDREKK